MPGPDSQSHNPQSVFREKYLPSQGQVCVLGLDCLLGPILQQQSGPSTGGTGSRVGLPLPHPRGTPSAFARTGGSVCVWWGGGVCRETVPDFRAESQMSFSWVSECWARRRGGTGPQPRERQCPGQSARIGGFWSP